jgi:hypothetical protein
VGGEGIAGEAGGGIAGVAGAWVAAGGGGAEAAADVDCGGGGGAGACGASGKGFGVEEAVEGDGVARLGVVIAGKVVVGSRLSLYHSRTMKSGSSILLRFILCCWPDAFVGLTPESKTSRSFSKNYLLVLTF